MLPASASRMRSCRKTRCAPESVSRPAATASPTTATSPDGASPRIPDSSVTVSGGPRTAATCSTSRARGDRKSSRRTIVPGSVRGSGSAARPGDRAGVASSATWSATSMQPSRDSAATSSLTYSGFPAAPHTISRSCGPGGAPVRCPTRPATAAGSSGSSRISADPCCSMLRSSPARCSSRGTGRQATSSSSGNCPAVRLSRWSTDRLAGSAHWRSSSRRATGPAAHHCSTRSRIVSVTANSWLVVEAVAVPSGAGSVTGARPALVAAGPIPRHDEIAANGSRCSISSATPRTSRIPSRPHSAATRSISVLLPIPGSPASTADRPCPRAASRARASSCDSSASRPTNTPEDMDRL